MKIKRFENNYSRLFFLFLLIIIVGLITYLRVSIQLNLGPVFDTFDFLANAALFAGKGIGYSDLLRPPLLPFLTSIWFMFDGLSTGAIFIIDGLLYLLGCIGLYFFLKERFTPIISFVGSLLFATLPIVLTYAGTGFNDVSSVSIVIWAVYFTHLGVKNNSKFFFLAFPVAMMAFLTRYNMALIIFPMFLYILISRNEIKNPKDIIIGIFLGVLVLIPVFLFFNSNFGNPLYPFMDFFGTSGGTGSSEHFAYNPDLLYFVKYLPYYLGTASLLIIISTFPGILAYFYKNIGKIWALKSDEYLKSGVNVKILLLLVMFVVFIVTLGKVHYLLSEVVIFIITILLCNVFNEWELDLDLDLLFFSWFVSFLIFQSVYIAKDHRYFITMAAPAAYFLARGLSFSTEMLKIKFQNKNLTLYIFSIFLVILMLSATTSQLSGIENENAKNKIFTLDVSNASQWLKNNDTNYKSKVIYADYWPYFAWYLGINVGKMPIFRDNQRLLVGPKDYNFTMEDQLALNQELNKIGPDYYLCAWKEMNFTNYVAVQKFGKITIYKKIEPES